MALDAVDLLARFRARSRSPVEALEGALTRIERDDPAVNAFRLVDADRTRAEAAAAEERWARGEPRGLLDGVPVAIKEVLLTKGWPTLRGSRVDARCPDAADVRDDVVRRCRPRGDRHRQPPPEDLLGPRLVRTPGWGPGSRRSSTSPPSRPEMPSGCG